MAELATTLFFQNNRNYGVGIITFDLILEETHNYSNSVTRYKIEDGSNISDHIQNEVESGSITGLITNFSLFDGVLLSNKAQDVFNQLRDLYLNKELVDIVTVLKVYENVAITNISVPRNSESGEELISNFSFEQVDIVNLQEVLIEATIRLNDMNSDLNRQAAVELNAGKTLGLRLG